MSTPDLSLVVPCYNEATHIKKSFSRLIKALDSFTITYEIILVEDNSTDQTLQVLQEIIKNYQHISIKLIHHSQNLGRGKTVMDGIKQSRGHIVGYLDIDLEISPLYIKKVLPLFSVYDVVVARRTYNFSIRSIHRYITSNTYRHMSTILLGLPIHDSESGFKFFNRKKILPTLKKIDHDGWFWDTEIVYYAHKMNLRIGEISVRYIRNHSKSSTVHTLQDSLYYLRTISSFYIRRKM